MKKLLTILIVTTTLSLNAQTVTDSVNTSIGDFILVTTESVQSSEVYEEESITTSDGGSGEFVGVTSNARFAQPTVVSSQLQISLIPNPSAGVTELRVLGMTGTASIVVTNVLGQIVYSSNHAIETSKQVYLPSQLWESGTYLVVVSNGVDVKAERLVVE